MYALHVARRSHTVEREQNRSRGARPCSAHPVRGHHCSQIRRQLGGGDLCVVAEALEQQQHGGDLGRVVERPGRLREGGVQLRAHVLVEEREVAQLVRVRARARVRTRTLPKPSSLSRTLP